MKTVIVALNSKYIHSALDPGIEARPRGVEKLVRNFSINDLYGQCAGSYI